METTGITAEDTSMKKWSSLKRNQSVSWRWRRSRGRTKRGDKWKGRRLCLREQTRKKNRSIQGILFALGDLSPRNTRNDFPSTSSSSSSLREKGFISWATRDEEEEEEEEGDGNSPVVVELQRISLRICKEVQ